MTQAILFEEMAGTSGNLGVITLNRPEVLNSLNHEMIAAMHPKLTEWAHSNTIKAVVIRAVPGRAFCAGGDIRVVYERARQQNPLMTEFFHAEYQLNRAIYHFPKPYIALLDGITMGGGVGISLHGSHRVATDNIMFAMPETGIGFFPDVGGTYFLPRLPFAMGYYLGLTGARLKVDDCTSLGLATHKTSESALPEIIQALCDTPFQADARQSVTDILAQFSSAPSIKTDLSKAQADIQHCFQGSTVEEIMQRLQASTQALCQDALKQMQKKSPTSLKVTLKAFNNGKNINFDACMRQEFRLVSRFLLAHDFIEGIRAAIIDKDQTPAWQPSSLAEVPDSSVEQYFEPLTNELA